MSTLFTILDVLASICFVLSLVSSVVMIVGWLTCSDYYYKITKFGDGFPAFIHTFFTCFLSFTIGVGYFVTGNFFIPPVYLNFIYWAALSLFLILQIFVSYVLDLRQYFANKRGR